MIGPSFRLYAYQMHKVLFQSAGTLLNVQLVDTCPAFCVSREVEFLDDPVIFVEPATFKTTGNFGLCRDPHLLLTWCIGWDLRKRHCRCSVDVSAFCRIDVAHRHSSGHIFVCDPSDCGCEIRSSCSFLSGELEQRMMVVTPAVNFHQLCEVLLIIRQVRQNLCSNTYETPCPVLKEEGFSDEFRVLLDLPSPFR